MTTLKACVVNQEMTPRGTQDDDSVPNLATLTRVMCSGAGGWRLAASHWASQVGQ